MNTEKLEKLKKSLDNKFIPDNMKDKIRAEIKKIEAEIEKESKSTSEINKEVKEVEKKVEETIEKGEETAEQKAEAKKSRGRPAKAKETPAEPKATETTIKKTAMAVAKSIRKDGEKWSDAMKRANEVMNKEIVEAKKTTKSELDRLLARVRKNKSLMSELSGVKDLSRDAVRQAKPVGKRVSADGNVYYEYRANKTDRKTFGKYAFADGGELKKGDIVYIDMGYGEGVERVKIMDDFKAGKSEIKFISLLPLDRKSAPYTITNTKLNKVIVKKDSFELGGSVVTDLAGHNGGTFGAINHGMLDGFSGTNYTGLVGETGAMSSGELFMDGGAIENQYEGKTPAQVWSLWTEKQKVHFLLDHFNHFDVDDFKGKNLTELAKMDYKNIPVLVRKELDYHVNKGQYAKGGEIEFQRSNLRIIGTGIDTNGNRVVKVSIANQRPFSIQTNGNLPNTHRLLKGYDKNTNFYEGEIESMENEIVDYVENYGSPNQKKSLKIYSNWLDKDNYAIGGSINDKTTKMRKMRKQRLKKGDNVFVIGRRWFDRVNGNTYHTAEVEVNGIYVGKSRMTYGYDEQYLETAKEILLQKYDLPKGMNENSPLWRLREYGVILNKSVIDGKKRDLEAGGFMDGVYAEGGGVRIVNGREYPTGRNWTNEHRHIDKADEREVNYVRKKSFAHGGGVDYVPQRIQERLEYLRGEIRKEDISYDEILELESLREYIAPDDVELLQWVDVEEDEFAKGGKVSLFKNIMETNTITEKEINLIKLRMNNNKVDEDTQEIIDYIWDNSPQLTPDQNRKGIDYLRNLWKSPTGKERANNPFGYREQEALETFEYFELRGFYDAGNRYHKFYVPLYICVGAETSFEYYISGGQVNIVG